jgi:hypothetical protein
LIVDVDDKVYSISIQAADDPLFLGLVYYELHDTGEKQTRFDYLKDMANKVGENIPELPPESWWYLLPPGRGWFPVPG